MISRIHRHSIYERSILVSLLDDHPVVLILELSIPIG